MGALAAAVRRRLLPYYSAAHVELPSGRRPVATVWVPEQLAGFLEAAAQDRQYALYHLIALAGLRRGEAMGLR